MIFFGGYVCASGVVSAGESTEPQELADVAEGDQVPYYCPIHPHMTGAIAIVAPREEGKLSLVQDGDDLFGKRWNGD